MLKGCGPFFGDTLKGLPWRAEELQDRTHHDSEKGNGRVSTNRLYNSGPKRSISTSPAQTVLDSAIRVTAHRNHGSSAGGNSGPRTKWYQAIYRESPCQCYGKSAGERLLFGSGDCPSPGVSRLPVGLSPDEVRAAIAYIVEKDYIKKDLYQSQLAIWNLTDCSL
jgi:hypothetical protein